jgi:hypothetical protein
MPRPCVCFGRFGEACAVKNRLRLRDARAWPREGHRCCSPAGRTRWRPHPNPPSPPLPLFSRGAASITNGTHALFIGGQNELGVAVDTVTSYQSSTGRFSTAATAAYTVNRGAAIASVGATVLGAVASFDDRRVWALGGLTAAGVRTSTVAYFDGRAWSTLTPAAPGGSPAARTGASATYVTNCRPLDFAPQPCVLLFGGEDASGALLADIWLLWVGETTPRWEYVPAMQSNGPPATKEAAISVAPDGSTVFIWGGTRSTGPTDDMFALSIPGFSDFTNAEAVNLAVNMSATESSTDSFWGWGGPGRANDDNLIQAHDNGPPSRACTCTLPQLEPWWKVDILATRRIDRVVIYPRNDCCQDRYFDYEVYLGNNNASARANPSLPRPFPNLGGQAVTINLASNPMYGRYFHFILPGPATNRVLTLCEVQLWQKLPYIWRKLSGISNVALGKLTAQSSIETGYAGGEAFRGVDGITSNNYGSSPPTCSATANTGLANAPWWYVDLGQTFDISTMEYWPRTDGSLFRADQMSFHVGYSTDSAFSNRCPGVPASFGAASGGRTIGCPMRGRYVIIRRTPTTGDNILHVCELRVFANSLLNQPRARTGMSHSSFRGHMVVFGGSDSTGFRTSDVRMFDMVSRTWLAPVTPLGTPPAPRAYAHFQPLPDLSLSPLSRPSTDVVIYSGQGNADVLTDASLLRFPSCPAFARDGIAGENCTMFGTVCIYTCYPGIPDANNGKAVICREDGQWDGIVPPCLVSAPGLPRNLASSVIPASVGTVNVTYDYPISSGYYNTGGTAANIRTFQVQAVPSTELVEDFSSGNFPVPSAWRRFAEFPALSNNHYFADGKLWLDAAAGSDLWIPTLTNTPPTVAAGTLYRGLILHRDWPAQVDVTKGWAYEALLEAGTLPNNAQLAIGIFDPTQCPYTPRLVPDVCNGNMLLYAGLRRVNEAWGWGFESIGGRSNAWYSDFVPSTSIYVRVEYTPTGAFRTDVGYVYDTVKGLSNNAQRFTIYYKFRANDNWTRMAYFIENQHLFNGTFTNPYNFRPAIIAKQWNANVYGRSLSAVRYIRVGPLTCSSPGCRRTVPGTPLLPTTLPALTPNGTYTFAVRASSDAGYGPWATTTVPVQVPPPVAPATFPVIEAASRKRAFMSSSYNGVLASLGNDGDFNSQFHTNCAVNQWWGVDLGVENAAVKYAYIRNRADSQWNSERFRHFSFFVGPNGDLPRNNWGIFARDVNPEKFSRVGDAFGMWNMVDGVSTPGSEGRFDVVGYGRFFFVSNPPFNVNDNCLHLREIQVYVSNACPARTAVGATQITTGGRTCANGAFFGSICEYTCNPGFVPVSGSAQAVCNGETWNGAPYVCAPACADVSAPTFSAGGQHEILALDFKENTNTSLTGNMALAVDSIEPILQPFARYFAVVDGVLNAFSRIGCNSEPAVVFYLEKIRAMDGNAAFTYTSDVSTVDRAGLIFRVQNSRNFYRVSVDVVMKFVVVEKVVAGIATTLTNARVPALLADTFYAVRLDVDGAYFNVSLNGRLVLQSADRQFTQGYVGLFASTTASFDNVRFVKAVTVCSGLTHGERCIFSCAPGLVTKGPSVRQCLTDPATLLTAAFNPGPAPVGSPPTHPNNLLCTLDPPSFPPATIQVAENAARGVVVGDPLIAISTSPDYSVSYLITAQFPPFDPSGTGQGIFSVDFCSGQVKVSQGSVLDFESRPSWLITVRAFVYGFEGAETYRNVTVTVLDIDEPPVIMETYLRIPEGSAPGTVVGLPVWWDPDNSTVTWSLDVDSAGGRFALNASTGALTVVAPPSNVTGFLTSATGGAALLNFETLGMPYELVLVASQTSVKPGTVGNPSLSSLVTSGKVFVSLSDVNDPPLIANGAPLLIREAAAAAAMVVGDVSVIDEDEGSTFNSTVAPTLVPLATYNTFCSPSPGGAVRPLTDTMFTVLPSSTKSVTIRLTDVPNSGTLSAFGAWRDMTPFAYTGGILVRAVYTLCLQADDGLGGVTVLPVDVAVVAAIAGEPVVYNLSLASYQTVGGETVLLRGDNFAPLTAVAPPRAWYSNGVYSYNATNCAVLDATTISCRTVPGIGKDFVWTLWWDDRRPALVSGSLAASYEAPTVLSVVGHTGMATTGADQVTITGLNFGPPGTPVTVRLLGATQQYSCLQVLNASDSHTVVRCNPGDGAGTSLPFVVVVGGQTITPALWLWSYAPPVISSISVLLGAGFTPATMDTAGSQSVTILGTNFGPLAASVAVTFGGVSNSAFSFACTKSAANPHTRLSCSTPPGVGFNMGALISVEAQAATLPYLYGGVGLSYLGPIVNLVTGEGVRNANTGGSQELVIEGRYFGPSTLSPGSVDFVRYGHGPADLDRYQALSCRVSAEPPAASQLTCLTAPGVGRNHSLYVSIGGQVSPVFAAGVSYAPPQIASFSGSGAVDGKTVGGDSVVVTGFNFGPADAYTAGLLSVAYGVKLEVPVVAADPATTIISNVSYTASPCTITQAHTQLTCTTAEGAGRLFQWLVTLDGQVSTQPTTSYAAPVITAITYADGVTPVAAADVNGGERVVLTGGFYGPTSYGGTGLPLVQRVTYGLSGTEYDVPRSAWTLVSHTRLEVILLPGTGTNLVFRVTVADQPSTSSPAASFSFALPSVDALTPVRAGTFSSKDKPTVITVAARNLPLRDPNTRITLTFGNVNPDIRPLDVPQGLASIAAATNPDGTVNVSFPLPEDGGGLAQGVRFLLGPVTTTVPAYTTPVSNASAYDYSDPFVSAVVVTRARFVPEDGGNTSYGGAVPCPFDNGWAVGAAWSCADPLLHRIEITGRDFGSRLSSRQDGLNTRLELLTNNYTALGIVGLGEVWSESACWVASWGHASVVAYMRVRSGVVRVSVFSPPFWAPATLQGVSAVATFLDVSPEIGNLVAAPDPYPTVGGSLADALVLSVENIATADSLEVFVGGTNATLVNPAANQPFADANAVKAYILATANLGTNPSFAGAWTFNAVVPPGQGLRVPVVVYRIRGATRDGSGTGLASTINYRAPVLTSVSVYNTTSGVWAGELVTANTNIKVNTDGTTRVRLTGTDLGTDPVVLVGDGYVLGPGAAGVIAACPGTAGLHTCYEFSAPPGEGDGKRIPPYAPLGFTVRLDAGNQNTNPLGYAYSSPVVYSVTAADPAASGANATTGARGFPTRGGVLVTLAGDQFGEKRPFRPDSAIVVRFGRPSEPTSWLECANPVRVSHTLLNCTLPEGAGKNLNIDVSVAGVDAISPWATFSYDGPAVTGWSIAAGLRPASTSTTTTGGGAGNATLVPSGARSEAARAPFAHDVLRPAPAGGDVITLTGTNFGARNDLHCAFLTWAYRSSDAGRGASATWMCNRGEDWLGEGEVDASLVDDWTHERISFRVPPGLGVKELQLSVRGSTLALPQGADAARGQNRIVRYLAPVVEEMAPLFIDTEGGEVVTLRGRNMGPTPRNVTDPAQALLGEVFTSPVPLALAPALPTAYMAVVFHRACVTNARTVTGGSVPNSVTLPMPYGAALLSRCADDVLVHEDGRVALLAGPGIGRNRTAAVVIIDGPEAISSDSAFFSYFPPRIEFTSPNPVYLAGADVELSVFGSYFGNFELAGPTKQAWSPAEVALAGTVGGVDCVGTVGRTRETNVLGRAETVVHCSVNSAVVPAGPRNITLAIAGQTGFLSHASARALLVVCAPGYYGRENETCIPCPAQNEDPAKRGAECRGYVAPAAGSPGVHTYPRPLPGWFNLNSTDSITRANGVTESMLAACPDGYQDSGRDVCIVPCDPPESCVGNNFCAFGYTSTSPMFRCASCDKGFYKRAGQCIKCPDSPAGLFVGFAVLVVFVASVGFFLNQKGINIAVISIGIDFFQVLAIFSQTRIKWPPVVKELFHVLSAFNLNIEIVAPECLIPDVSYKAKFWFIMLLPLSVGGLLALNYVLVLAYKALILGQDKRRSHDHAPALVSSTLVLLYILYLYLTRTILDVFNCTPTSPPDGYTYLQVVFERCNVPGGTQMVLLPFAVAGLIVYTGGYPALVGYSLWKRRELVMEDQLLRAKGAGNDTLTGPRTFKLRRTLGRSYFQFKPDNCLWILAIILRKLLIALTAVVFNKNASFQMAACLLVMFVAYAAQVHVRPYMSPANFEDVLKAHVESSYANAVHARLRANLATIETRGRKKVRKNLLNFEGKVDRSAVFGLLAGWLFNYNTVEEIMLFAAVIVCLMGIMYQANEVSTYYPESKDSVTAVVLIVIIGAIVYFAVVFITEIVVLYNEDQRAMSLARAARRGGGGGGGAAKGLGEGKGQTTSGGGGGGGKGGSGKLVDAAGEINVGKLDTQTNPLFMKAGGDGGLNLVGGGADGAGAVDAILSQRDAPPTEIWRMFQTSYAELHGQVKELQNQLVAARKENAFGGGGAVGNNRQRNGEEDDEGGAKLSVGATKRAFAPKAAGGSSNPMLGSAGAAASSGKSLRGLRAAGGK